MLTDFVMYYVHGKKYSEIRKRARGKLLHTHTSGSQSYAVKRDSFVRVGNNLHLYTNFFSIVH